MHGNLRDAGAPTDAMLTGDRISAASASGPRSGPRAHLVWTRALDGVPTVGRIKVARAVRAAFRDAGFSLTESVLRPLTTKPTGRRWAAAFGRLLGSILRGRPMPLQCLLFGDHLEAGRMVAEIPENCDAVYLDGVRCLAVLRAIARDRPDVAILTDFDDLMSRRMSLLLDLDQPPSTGYLKTALPGFIEPLLASRWVSRLVLRYEAASLRQTEREVAELSDAVVLISSKDAADLRGAAPNADVRVIPFAEKVRRASPRLKPGPLRFIFVGTDGLRQNQLTIDALIGLWLRERIATPLVIYGEQQRRPDLPPNVSMPGYAENIEDIYDGRSILVSPSFLAGGLKTKVLEAFAHAAPVLGNRITFEAIAVGTGYPLLIENEEGLLPLLQEPELFRDRFEQAAAMGLAIVREHHAPAEIDAAWVEAAHAAISRRKGFVEMLKGVDFT